MLLIGFTSVLMCSLKSQRRAGLTSYLPLFAVPLHLTNHPPSGGFNDDKRSSYSF